jgi:hypothetical protein
MDRKGRSIGQFQEGDDEGFTIAVASGCHDRAMPSIRSFATARIAEDVLDVFTGDAPLRVIRGDVPEVVLPPDDAARLHISVPRTYDRPYIVRRF